MAAGRKVDPPEPSQDAALTVRESARAEDTSPGAAPVQATRPSLSSAPVGSSAPTTFIADRYEDRGRIARGAMGEVRRVYDHRLRRMVAMKLLAWELIDEPSARRRFANEISITAGLQHPGIVAVHDSGRLDGGRPWFTMKEVQGRTFETAVVELHAAVSDEHFQPTEHGVTLMRLIEAFRRICEAVAFAHSHGIIHRDLKPSNLMLGPYGEVLVMDWGVAKRAEEDSGPLEGGVDWLTGSELTRHGDVVGTPHYMSPEQASGDPSRVDARSDVYALGAVLRFILLGRAPYAGSGREALARLRAGPPLPFEECLAPGQPAVPEALVRICERAMERAPARRFPDAAALDHALDDFIEGARRYREAIAVIRRAEHYEAQIERLRERAAEERAAAAALRDAAASSPGEMEGEISVEKRRMWRHEDRAAAIDRDAVIAEVQWLQLVRSALEHDAELGEAHERLADHYARRLVEADQARDAHAITRNEAMLRKHDRGRHRRLLSATGALTLVTNPPGAAVLARRYETVDRKLVPGEVVHLGVTPLIERPLPKGSYEISLMAPGRSEVRYPVLIERGDHWDGVPPGASEPEPIVLPRPSTHPRGMVYVPSGWCWSGGDPLAVDSLPLRRIWVDGFFAGRFCVTNAEYLVFLNALLDQGREEEALRYAPREPMGSADGEDALLALARDAKGRFGLTKDALGVQWEGDWPVALVDWHAAVAYADWLAELEGFPFRLPSELEWEKLARGVDGRRCAWGDFFEPTWACILGSHRGPPRRSSVHSFPYDESPYGARGVMGNVRQWCLNAWRSEGPPVDNGRLVPPEPAEGAQMAARGGSWNSTHAHVRPAARFASRPSHRYGSLGFRIVAPLNRS